MTEAAKIVLGQMGRPMRTVDLVREIESKGLFKFGAKKPESVLSGALSKRPDIFVRTAPATYGLKASES